MEEYNKAMSAVRISVEWLFGDIINYFKFLDFKKNLKISLSAVGKIYMACAILRNALICMYGNSTSGFLALFVYAIILVECFSIAIWARLFILG